MNTSANTPKLYNELASWWPLLSAPEDYAEEADFFYRVLLEACAPQTLLELGSGGGNNAFHLKAHFRMTLVDASEFMLAVSWALNPECEHHQGDMRDIRLGRQFDAVFIHDAVDYMTTEVDLQRAIETAYTHCRTNGAALLAPDHVRENFVATTEHGGHDNEGRGLRYLEWTHDADPRDSQYVTDYAYLLHAADGTTRVEYDRHVLGLFSRNDWLKSLRTAGFEPRIIPDAFGRELFLGIKR